MRYEYSEFDGQEFLGQDSLRMLDGLMEFVLEYGEPAMDALKQMELDPEQAKIIDELARQGMLEKLSARWRLTPRAIAAMQRKALMETFSRLRKGTRDGHPVGDPGQLGERIEGTRPWQFGDPASELDLSATLRNALKRGGPGLPVKLGESDFELHQSEHQASCSTVILLDMSGSMARWHRFYHAKKTAMAVHALITQSFPRDTVDVVGFYSAAAVIPEHKLPLAGPKPVSLFDSQVAIRVPIDQADQAPQHFTNLHMGLMLARRILSRRGGDNKQVFIITDGQPTAHVEGEHIVLLYPPRKVTTLATLREAFRMSRDGVRICTFALTEDYEYLDWVGFVDQLTRATKGVAFYSAGGDLSECIMESYLSGRRRRTALS